MNVATSVGLALCRIKGFTLAVSVAVPLEKFYDMQGQGVEVCASSVR